MGNKNSGPRPKPTALHVLRGNPSHKNLNTNEVCPPSGEVEKPEGLSAGASGVWDELVPILTYMGVLTQADAKAFRAMCELQATFEANTAVKGTEKFDVRLERDTATTIRAYYDYFGMTPSSRARIAVPKKAEQQESKWAGIK